MQEVFISYKRLDKDKVFNIKRQIESKLRVDCWIDIDGIKSADQFMNVIIEAINNCKIVLFMYSKEHTKITDFDNDWTLRELNFAITKKKRIVFINIDGSDLTDQFTFQFGTKQQIDGRRSEAISRLCDDMANWLGIKGPDPTPSKWEKFKNFIKRYKYYLITACVSLFFLIAGLMYYCKPPIDSPVQLEAVDLGLPSGTKWANLNIGANCISDYGSLYSWGECNVKKNYGDNGYHLEIPVSNISRTKYDVAYSKLGEGWEIPSEADFKELKQNCTWVWQCKFNHYGYLVTGKNGNSIFLPASGWSRSTMVEYQNIVGYYWTCKKSDDKYARYLSLDKGGLRTHNGAMYIGRSIRGIQRVKK